MHYLDFASVAATLGQSELTIRAIANRFALYVPVTRAGTQRLFPEHALDVFRLIVQQLEVGIGDDTIEEMLGRRYPAASVLVTPAIEIPAAPAMRPHEGRTHQGETPFHIDSGTIGASPEASQPGPDPAATAALQALEERMRHLETLLVNLPPPVTADAPGEPEAPAVQPAREAACQPSTATEEPRHERYNAFISLPPRRRS